MTKRRKKNLLRKTMAVLLAAILFVVELPGNISAAAAEEWGTVSGNEVILSSEEPDMSVESVETDTLAGPVEVESVSGNGLAMMVMAAAAESSTVITSDTEWSAQTLSAGTYTIASGVTVTVTGPLTVSGDVTINGGGTLARAASYTGVDKQIGSSNCLLYVNSGTLTLENITVDGKGIDAYGPALYIASGNSVNLQSGATIRNNRNLNTHTDGTYSAGGVYCGGTLNINGGSIVNCCTNGEINTSKAYSRAGGAIYLKGTCTMTSGSITGNSASNGGGIYLASNGARLNLSGGTISGNHAATNGNGDGIYYSTVNNSTSILHIGGSANVVDVIYLDNTRGTLCPKITSSLNYPIRLACSSQEEGRVLAEGDGYTLTGVDASKVSMMDTNLFSRLDTANNNIYLSTTEEVEATWQETSGGEWKTGKFTTALEKVYDGGTIKLLKDILLTHKAEIKKQVTITSNDPSAPCTITRMPDGEWGNITLTGSGASLTLTNMIYDGNRAYLSGAGNASTQSLIKVGSDSDDAPSLTLGTGCVIRNGYKSSGSGVIAVYGTLNAQDGSLIENCEVVGTGGAIWIHSGGNATLRGITIQGCRAGGGGSALSIDGTCELVNCVLRNNVDSSERDCAVYLRASGQGNLKVTGKAEISGGVNSIYNDGKTVSICGKEKLVGHIYTTNALNVNGSGVDADLSGNPHSVDWGAAVADGTVVVRGCTNTTDVSLANEGYSLRAENGALVMRRSWQVVYHKNGGAIANESAYTEYTAGVGLSLPIPTKAGCSFGGWYTDSACTSGRTTAISASATGDKAFYAKWVQNHRCSALGSEREFSVFPTMTGGTLEAGSYFLDRDVDLTTEIEIGGVVDLCLNGHQIKQTGSGQRIFLINNGGRLNLCDCNGSQGSHTVTSLVTGEQITISGGLLTGGSPGGWGGAVMVNTGGGFHLYGGTLAANTSTGAGTRTSGHGGAVRAEGAFYMYGGEICHNKSGCGGGICICGGETRISGGRVAYNESLDDGGGVFFESSSVNKFSMSGGAIVNNRAVTCGGGVHYFTGVMEVSGSAVIRDNVLIKNSVTTTDNVYLNDDRVLMVGSLESGAQIGVSSKKAPTGEAPIPVTGSGSGQYVSNFFSDNAQYDIVNRDNVVKLIRDEQAPTGTITVETNRWSTLLGKVTFGLFFKETKKAVITAQDDISGVSQIFYFISDKALTETEVRSLSDWLEGTECSISPDRQCVIYAKITDKQNNIAYISSDGMVFDATAPKITGVEDGKTYCLSATATVADSYLDSVTVNGVEVVLDGQGRIELASANAPQIIAATDKAGNRTAVTVTVQPGHSYGSWNITNAPTFTAAGSAQRVCAADNSHRETVSLPALSDAGVWTATVKTAPTRDGAGSMEYTSEYGKVTAEIPALSDPSVWTPGTRVEPTETQEGTQEYTSTEYGKVVVKIPPLSDTDVWTLGEKTEPTETEEGTQEYTSAEYGKVEVKIPALSDTDVWTPGTRVEPTETQEGTQEYISMEYGKVVVKIPPLSDTDVWTPGEKTEPTETEEGTQEYTSAEYGKVEVKIPALSDTDVWTPGTRVEPTETQEGSQEYISAKYGTVTIKIPPLRHRHRYDDWGSNTEKHWRVCSCGEKTDMGAHSFGEWVTDREATENVPGNRCRTCEECGFIENGTIMYGGLTTEVEEGENVPATSFAMPEEELKEILLTEDDRQQMDNGQDIRFLLTVTDAETTVSEEDKAAVDSVSSGWQLGQYLDVSLFKQVGDSSYRITETTGKIRITVEVPEHLRNPDREYAIVRVHNGKTSVLADTDDREDTITIETDRFSTYSIIYRDTEKPSESDDPGETEKPTEGDDSGEAEKPTEGENPGEAEKPTEGENPGDTEKPTEGDGPGEAEKPTEGEDPGDAEKPTEGDGTGDAEKPTEGNETGDAGTSSESSENKTAGTAVLTPGESTEALQSPETLQSPVKDNEPKTGDDTPVELCATLTMIGGMGYLLLYFAERRGGMSEEEKKELTARIIRWARRGGRIRRLAALAAIFVVLVYYHSICRKVTMDWDAKTTF